MTPLPPNRDSRGGTCRLTQRTDDWIVCPGCTGTGLREGWVLDPNCEHCLGEGGWEPPECIVCGDILLDWQGRYCESCEGAGT